MNLAVFVFVLFVLHNQPQQYGIAVANTPYGHIKMDPALPRVQGVQGSAWCVLQCGYVRTPSYETYQGNVQDQKSENKRLLHRQTDKPQFRSLEGTQGTEVRGRGGRRPERKYKQTPRCTGMTMADYSRHSCSHQCPKQNNTLCACFLPARASFSPFQTRLGVPCTVMIRTEKKCTYSAYAEAYSMYFKDSKLNRD